MYFCFINPKTRYDGLSSNADTSKEKIMSSSFSHEESDSQKPRKNNETLKKKVQYSVHRRQGKKRQHHY